MKEICPHCGGRLFKERDAAYGEFLHCFCGYDELLDAPEPMAVEGRTGRHAMDPVVSNSESIRRYRLGMKARAAV